MLCGVILQKNITVMAYQERTTTSYGQRLGKSGKGIGTGFLLLIAGTVLLWINEGRAVKTTRMLNEAEKTAIHVEDVSTVNPDLDGKLIHATGQVTTSDSLTDPIFGAGAVAVRMDREVEYYQWVENKHEETKDKIGGGQETITTYTYEKEWVGRPIESAEFKDPEYKGLNFTLANVDDKIQYAENVHFGAYRMPDCLIRQMSGRDPVEPVFTESIRNEWETSVKSVLAGRFPNDSTLAGKEYVHVNGNVVYFGRNANIPEIGDVRVTLTKVLPREVSLIAQVYQDNLKEYKAKNGKSFSTLTMGAEDMETMFSSEHSKNSTLTWILRIAGILLIVFGLKSITAILVTLFKVLPFLASIANFGVGAICWIIGLIWSIIVIAVAWIFYRPVLGVSLLVGAAVLTWYFIRRGKSVKPASEEVQPDIV